MIRVLLVDDQRLMRDGLSTLLSLEPDIQVIGAASSGDEAISITQAVHVDVVLMDIRMPGKNGIDTTRELITKAPGVKVLMLTTYDDEQDVVHALSAGALGYLLKDMPGDEIAAAIRTAHAGGAVLPPSVAKTLLNAVQGQIATLSFAPGSREHHVGSPGHQPDVRRPPSPNVGPNIESLTDREVDVLHCLARGMSNREMAQSLFVTEGTVKNHVSNLISKLGLRDRTQVALYAVRHGYGDLTLDET